MDCSLSAEIKVFRKSPYPYFPSKPGDLSRSAHLHKLRRITRRRCGALFPQQPWKIVPTPPQIYRTARIPLISVTLVISVILVILLISVTLQIPHKHLNLNIPKTPYFDNKAKRTFRHRKDLAGSSPESIRLHTSSLPCLERYGKCWFVRFQLTQDPGCT